MNCYFTCQKLSKFCNTCFTTTKETDLVPFNLAHPVGLRYDTTRHECRSHVVGYLWSCDCDTALGRVTDTAEM